MRRRALVRSADTVAESPGGRVSLGELTDMETTARTGRGRMWQTAVTALLLAWLVAQFAAGWKFANGTTYPIVGSAMFNGPPIPGSDEFLVPRVFGFSSGGERIEMDHNTFGLEPFEWRRWIKRNFEDAPSAHGLETAAELAAVYTDGNGIVLTRLEVWRIPALTDDLDRGRLIVTFRL